MLCCTYRQRYQKTRLSLESRLDTMSGELHTTQTQLEHEIQWRDHASSFHKLLLQEKSQLQAMYNY